MHSQFSKFGITMIKERQPTLRCLAYVYDSFNYAIGYSTNTMTIMCPNVFLKSTHFPFIIGLRFSRKSKAQVDIIPYFSQLFSLEQISKLASTCLTDQCYVDKSNRNGCVKS